MTAKRRQSPAGRVPAGRSDDAPAIALVMGDPCGHCSEGAHLLAVEQFLIGFVQLARPLVDHLLDPRIAPLELEVFVDSESGEDE